MQRRRLLAGGAATVLAGCAGLPAKGMELLRRVGFGSCFDQGRADQPVWDGVLASRPDLFIFGGDNVYCELPYTRPRLQRAYAQAAQAPGLARVRAATPHLAIWDDHDYGQNDGGADFAFKQEAKEEFLSFWRVPADDPRRFREGLYHAQLYGPPGRRVQVILLDGRWFRSPLKPTDQRNAPGRERYLPDPDPGKTMLGDAQWRWLEQQLRQPAQVRLVVSGVQVLAEGHGWERWGNLPRERERLLQLIARTQAGGLVFLSGDRHIGALYRESQGLAYPLHELTASGFTHTFRNVSEAGPNRLGDPYTELHFGLVDIDWAGAGLRLQLADTSGGVQRSVAVSFEQLKVTA